MEKSESWRDDNFRYKTASTSTMATGAITTDKSIIPHSTQIVLSATKSQTLLASLGASYDLVTRAKIDRLNISNLRRSCPCLIATIQRIEHNSRETPPTAVETSIVSSKKDIIKLRRTLLSFKYVPPFVENVHLPRNVPNLEQKTCYSFDK